MNPKIRFLSIVLLVAVLVIPLLSPGTVRALNPIIALPQTNTIIVPPGSPIEVAFATCNAFPNYQDAQDAVQMALDNFGSIHGFSLQRNDFLTLCDQTSGEIAANTMVANPQNAGVIGPLYSSSVIGAAPVFEGAGLVMISFGATSPDLPNFGPSIFNRTVVKDPNSDAWITAVNSQPETIAFKSDFQTLYGRSPDDFAVLAYDAASILLNAINTIGWTDGSGNLVIERDKLAAYVRLTISYPGSSGSVTFDAFGNRINQFTSQLTYPPGNPIQIAFATCNGFPNYQDSRDAVQLAITDYGPIKGFSVGRSDYLSLCDQTSGAAAANEMIANLANAGVIGPLYSSSVMGAAPVFESARLVMISHGATHPDLPNYGPTIFNRAVIKDPGSEDWLATVNQLPSTIAFKEDFQAQFGRAPEDFAVLAYDATQVLLEAIDSVSYLDEASQLVIDKAQLAARVRGTTNYLGKSGRFSFDAQGNRVDQFFRTVWDDPFNSPSLKPLWSWIDQDPTHWSLSEQPGFLRILTQAADKNRLVREIPRGNFEMRTRLLFKPSENYQIGALYVYGDEQNYLKFGRAYCDTPRPACVENGLYFDWVENQTGAGSNFATAWPISDEIYLRLVRDGNTFTAYASPNGAAWTMIGSHTIGFEPLKIGLTASNQSMPAGEIPADFDYFVAEYSDLFVYLPLVRR